MATIERYVDTDVVGGLGDGTSWANAYSSLNAWEAAEQTDLVSDGDLHIARCRASSGTADTTGFFIMGWTTGASNYIEIRVDPVDRWDGEGWADAAYRIDDSAGNAIYILEEYVRLTGLQLRSADDEAINSTASGAGELQISHCLFSGADSGSNKQCLRLVGPGASNDGVAKIWNCLFLDCPDLYYAAIYLGEANLTVYAENCTFVNVETGVRMSSIDQENFKNCKFDCTDAFYGTFTDNDANNDYNFSSENTYDVALGSNGAYNQTFSYVGGGDYHSASDDPCIGQGIDLSSGDIGFTDDIDGETRSAWDVGYDEYVSAGGISIPVVMNHLRQQGIA